MPGRLICPMGHHWDLEEEAPAGATPAACPICGALCPSAASSIEQNDEVTPRSGPKPADSWTLPGGGALGQFQPSEREAKGSDANDLPTVPGYQVLERLGAGGMGVVYKARQVVANRIVAVKMLRDAAADLETRFRFVAEAEAAARLQHPNIVQIFEVGETGGRPFLALEFCGGGSLAEQLDGTPLPPREAAALIERLAGAVEHAHRAGVVHRDLKPANVLLVSGESSPETTHHSPLTTHQTTTHQPKIADFGLARRLDVDQGQTQSGTILGTPSYMAPEQASGDSKRVGPAADVYALGAILYEMLTGRPPFTGETVYETFRQVRDQEPVPPRRLQPKVPRDLETICLKCLQKEPRKRYATAGALADDVRNFREGRPVRARPVSSLERLGKWVRRRPGIATLVGLLGLAVAGSLVGGAWYQVHLKHTRDRAETNLEGALDAIETFLTEVADDEANEPHMEQKRRALLEKALTLCQKLLQSEGNSPRVREHVALAHWRVGDIQRQLGHYSESLAAYERAVPELEALTTTDPARRDLLQHLADCHNFAGEVHRLSGRPSEAVEAYHRALVIQVHLHDAEPENADYVQDLARSHYNLGIVASKDLNQLQQAKVELSTATNLLKRVPAPSAVLPTVRQHLARAYLNLGPVLAVTDGQAPAQSVLERAAGLLDGLVREIPYRAEYRRELAAALNNLGRLHLRDGCLDEARSLLGEGGDLLRKLVADFPDQILYRTDLANTSNTLAAALAEGNQPDAADQWWGEAEAQWRELFRRQPEVPDYRGSLGVVLGNRGRLRLQHQGYAEARAFLESAFDELIAGLKPNVDHPDFRTALRKLSSDLANTLTRLGDHEAARRHAHALHDALPDHGAGTHYAVCLLARCVGVLRSQPTSNATSQVINEYIRLSRDLIDHSPQRSELIRGLLNDPAFTSLRDDPAFADLLPTAVP